MTSLEWTISPELVAYPDALLHMEQRVDDILARRAGGLVWLLEHPPLYTAGTSARATDLLEGGRFPVYSAGRGGQYTYHGPGQRVAYVMCDLKALFAPGPPDIRRYVAMLEQWVIATLAHFGVQGFTREGRVGVWVHQVSGSRSQVSEKEEVPVSGCLLTPDTRHLTPGHGEAKIAAIGIRVRKWVAFHGICLNVSPDLSHYAGIVPCGIREHGVTSLQALGIPASMQEVDAALKRYFSFSLARAATIF